MKWDREPLRISENGRYFMEGDRPFFWLADTAWLMLQKLNLEDIAVYLRNRKEKGFNVIMTVLVHTLPGVSESGCSLAPGIKDVTDGAYWNFVDRALDMAEELGLYAALLPSWGSLVKDRVLDERSMERYAEFLGKRFRGRRNIIWVLGGDVRGDVAPELFRMEAEILKKHDPERLIAFHPFGRTSSSLWFAGEKWLDFNMYQSGHRRYDQATLGRWDDNKKRETFFGEDNWRYADRDLATANKPSLDAEPSYEGIPQGLHDPREPFWEEWDARRYAYWSVFAGAAGHTYGSSAIMQFYSPDDGKGSYGVRESWRDAMHHPGSAQMRLLKSLMESVDFVNGKPDDGLLLYGQKERYHRIAVFSGEDHVFCYTYSGDRFLLDLGRFAGKTLDAWWMDPRGGELSFISTIKGGGEFVAEPVRRKETANDWVLVIKTHKESI